MATIKGKLVQLLGEFSEQARQLPEPFNSKLATQETLYKGVLDTIPNELEERSRNAIEDSNDPNDPLYLKSQLHEKLFKMKQFSAELLEVHKNQLIPIEAEMKRILDGIYEQPIPKNTPLPFEDILGVNIGKYVDHFTTDEQARGGEAIDYTSFIDKNHCIDIPSPIAGDEDGIADDLIKYVRVFLLMEDIYHVKYEVIKNGKKENRRQLTTPVSHSRAKAQFRRRKLNPEPLRDNKLQLELNPEILPEDQLSVGDMIEWKNRLKRMKGLGMHIRVSPEMLKELNGIKRGFPDKWYRAEEWGCDSKIIQENAARFMNIFLQACKDPDGSYYFDVFEIGNEPWGQPGVIAYRAIAAGIIEGCINHFGNKNVDSWPIQLSHAAFQHHHEQHQLTREKEQYNNIYVSDNVEVMTGGIFQLPDDDTIYTYAQFIKELNIHLYPFAAKEDSNESPYNYQYNEHDISDDAEKKEIYARLKKQNTRFTEERIHLIKSNSLINAGPEQPASISEFANYKPFAGYAAAENSNWVVTEFGWTTGLDVVNKDDERFLRMGIGGIAQAAYMLRALLVLARHNVNKAYIYQSIDESGLGNFHSSGLFTIYLGAYTKPNGDPVIANLGTRKAAQGKPGYNHLRIFLQAHGKKRFHKVVKEELGGTYAYLIGESKPTHLVAWHAINADIENQTQQEQLEYKIDSSVLEIKTDDHDFKTKVKIGLIPIVFDLADETKVMRLS